MDTPEFERAKRYRDDGVQRAGDAAIEFVERHFSSHEWTDRDRIRLAFAFHMRFEKMSRMKVLERVLELTGRIQNRFEQNSVTAIRD